MPLTIVQEPSAIAFSENPMIIEFLAVDGNGDAYTAKGVRSELNADHSNGIVEDETLTIDYTEPDGTIGTITFTAKDNPATDLEMPTKSTPGIGVSVADYWDAVAAKIQAYPEVNRYFKVYAVENTVGTDYSLWIETVDIDSTWVLSWDESGIIIAPFTVTDSTTALATTAPGNYSIFVDVFFEDVYESTELERLTQIELPINSEGKAFIDLSEIISKAVKASLPRVQLSDYDSTTPIIADNLRNYCYRYREDYDSVTPTWTVVSNKLAMAGGVSQDLFATTDFLAGRSASSSILTWYPSGKMVSPNQSEWISWYNYTAGDKQILIELKTWTADSDTETTTYVYNTADPTVKQYQVALIPVGALQLAIAADVKKYSVRVIDYADYSGSTTVTYLSEARSFYVDRQPYKEIRYVMYENSFCLPETFRTVGDFNNQLNIQRSVRKHVLPVGYDQLSPQISQYRQEYNNQYTYRSGYLSRSEVDALQELLIYNRAFEVQSGGYVPLHKEGRRYQVYNTSAFLVGVQFVAIRSLKDKIYSRRAVTGGYLEIPVIPEPEPGIGFWQIGTDNIFTVS